MKPLLIQQLEILDSTKVSKDEQTSFNSTTSTQITNLQTTKLDADEQTRWNSMGFPGIILDFYGSLDDSGHPIPVGKTYALTNWHVCDGTNGTPDLQGRVTLGANSNYSHKSIGGSSSITPTITVAETTQETTIAEATQNTSIAAATQLTSIAEVAQATSIAAATQFTSIAESTQNTSIAAATQGSSINASTLSVEYLPYVSGTADHMVCLAYSHSGVLTEGNPTGADIGIVQGDTYKRMSLTVSFGSSWGHSHGINNPAHNHGITNPAHNHTLTNPIHSHDITNPTHNHTITNPEHTHTLTNPAHNHTITNPSHTHTATSTAINTMQPYYACYKIMRLS